MQLLAEAGAEVDAQGGLHIHALQAASYGGHEKVVRLLFDANTNNNARVGCYSNELYTPSTQGHKKVVQLLLAMGTDVNVQGWFYCSELQAASAKELVQILFDNGADVNAQVGLYGDALQAASSKGDLEISKLLLDNGADVNVQGGLYGDVLKAASAAEYHDMTQVYNVAVRGCTASERSNAFDGLEKYHVQVRLLGQLEAAQVHTARLPKGYHTRLYRDTIELLLGKGAQINAQGRLYGNALQAASYQGHDEVVQMLKDAGAQTVTKHRVDSD